MKRHQLCFFLLLIIVSNPLVAATWGNAEAGATYTPADHPIDGEYIVGFEDVTDSVAKSRQLVAQLNTLHGLHMKVASDYRSINAALVTQVTAAGLELILKDSSVSFVDQNDLMPVPELVPPDVIGGAESSPASQASNYSWALDRIDQRGSLLDGQFFTFGLGIGVDIYILDKYVETGHQEFSGRATIAADFVGGPHDIAHGTFMASLAAGNNVGVARGANIINLVVCNRDRCPLSSLLDAMQYVVDDHFSGPAVASISIQSSVRTSIQMAATAVFNDGVFLSASAGNRYDQSCDRTAFGVHGGSFTVGASTIWDELWLDGTAYPDGILGTGYGGCNELFAPGENVYAAVGNGGYAEASGASNATALVSGAAAVLMQATGISDPSAVRDTLIRVATKNRLLFRQGEVDSGSPDRLLYLPDFEPDVGLDSVTIANGSGIGPGDVVTVEFDAGDAGLVPFSGATARVVINSEPSLQGATELMGWFPIDSSATASLLFRTSSSVDVQIPDETTVGDHYIFVEVTVPGDTTPGNNSLGHLVQVGAYDGPVAIELDNAWLNSDPDCPKFQPGDEVALGFRLRVEQPNGELVPASFFDNGANRYEIKIFAKTDHGGQRQEVFSRLISGQTYQTNIDIDLPRWYDPTVDEIVLELETDTSNRLDEVVEGTVQPMIDLPYGQVGVDYSIEPLISPFLYDAFGRPRARLKQSETYTLPVTVYRTGFGPSCKAIRLTVSGASSGVTISAADLVDGVQVVDLTVDARSQYQAVIDQQDVLWEDDESNNVEVGTVDTLFNHYLNIFPVDPTMRNIFRHDSIRPYTVLNLSDVPVQFDGSIERAPNNPLEPGLFEVSANGSTFDADLPTMTLGVDQSRVIWIKYRGGDACIRGTLRLREQPYNDQKTISVYGGPEGSSVNCTIGTPNSPVVATRPDANFPSYVMGDTAILEIETSPPRPHQFIYTWRTRDGVVERDGELLTYLDAQGQTQYYKTDENGEFRMELTITDPAFCGAYTDERFAVGVASQTSSPMSYTVSCSP
ncbi:MAG: S8 family serine peptidase [Acidobacteriota bacterium]